MLVKECLNEAHALAESKGETLPWRECLPSGIRECKRMPPNLKRRAQRGDKAGEFMVERENEDDISTDNQEE